MIYDPDGGEVDTTPPNSPRNLRAETVYERSIILAWDQPLQAPDGDIASSYQIFRNGLEVGYAFNTTFTDSGLSENSTYSYAVYALDDYGNVSESAATGSFSTLLDQAPPAVESVRALNPTLISLTFTEPVEQVSAEEKNNYSIDNGISISSATLLSNNKTVQLITSEHSLGITYTITINNVTDQASIPNVILPNSTAIYPGVGAPVIVTLSADNNYELYINGEFVGSDTRWEEAETYYYFPQYTGKVVIAVKATDNISTAGFLAEINYGSDYYVTNESWKVTTVEQTGWQERDFNDQLWSYATSIGLHGVAEPWATYNKPANISDSTGVHWIWSADNLTEPEVYLRFTINDGTDTIPPAAPTGVIVIKP